MPNFLLEIGTEELPAEFARLALPQLEELIHHDLQLQRINYGDIRITSTPRRLIVQVNNLPTRQPDLEEERKGPPIAIGIENGDLGPAAIGFAKRCGINIANLEVRQTQKGSFVFARIHQPGKPTTTILAQNIPTWIASIQGKRFMRWGSQEQRFSRPIRWLVALFNNQVIPLTLANSNPKIKTNRLSYTHRILSKSIKATNATGYDKLMFEGQVVIDRIARATSIAKSINVATNSKARADIPDTLFTELVDLVENPILINGKIAERYLMLPPEILSTVMRIHQRYIPLYCLNINNDPLALNARDILLPEFLFVSNGDNKSSDIIVYGNERVLKARLADAEFFLQVDLNTTSIDRCKKLSSVVFSEGLGTLKDRSERLKWITDILTKYIPVELKTIQNASRAATFCKHDLVSQIVGEFPELQGTIGGKYLLAEGEEREVALAVLEHYMPRTSGDSLPSSEAGSIVALAERLELLLSIFAKGERPSGSSDPYALRRAGNGIFQILWTRNWSINLVLILNQAISHWSDLFPNFNINTEELNLILLQFLRQRIVSLLDDNDTDTDLIQAVAGDTTSLERLMKNPVDVKDRLKYLINLRDKGDLTSIQLVVQRASRLAEKGDLSFDVINPQNVINRSLFKSTSEEAIGRLIDTLYPFAINHEYEELAKTLSASTEVLADFFDGTNSVMVMTDDLSIRKNRLNLLAILRNQANTLADFSKLIN